MSTLKKTSLEEMYRKICLLGKSRKQQDMSNLAFFKFSKSIELVQIVHSNYATGEHNIVTVLHKSLVNDFIDHLDISSHLNFINLTPIYTL